MVRANRRTLFAVISLLLVIGLGVAWYLGVVDWNSLSNFSFGDLSVTAKALFCAVIVVLVVWALW